MVSDLNGGRFHKLHIGMVVAILSGGAAGCGGSEGAAVRPPPLAPLPAARLINTARFANSGQCGDCHLANSTDALRDAMGRDISPVGAWRTSMMAQAVRDPFYLAVVAEEREIHGDMLVAACLRCHAPAGHEETAGLLAFDELLHGDSEAAHLGREGITCSLCHQIEPAWLGEEKSFTGNFVVGATRQIYGPHEAPYTDPMRVFVNFIPTYAEHLGTSELCATCHTVIVGGVIEQATYLEWRSSAFERESIECQTCHLPAADETDTPYAAAIATYPDGLDVRTPLSRHTFVGANSYMQRLLGQNEAWANTGVPAGEFDKAAEASDAFLRGAAAVTIEDLTRDAAGVRFRVKVENQTGHKLPTAYPSRRMWLRVTIRAGDDVVFSSGELDAQGRLPGDDVGVRPHIDLVTTAAQVQVWALTLVDAEGEPTHRALAATRAGRDDRILPRGYAPSAADAARMQPIGTEADADFLPGHDSVTFQLPEIPANATLEVALLYQTLTRDLVETLDEGRTPASSRFVDMARAFAPAPIVMATATATTP